MTHNGVGLQSVRGSGTSGYVHKSLAHVQRMRKHQVDFQKQMRLLKENPLPPPRKANSEIVRHEHKRKVENHLRKLRRELEQKGESEQQIASRLEQARSLMLQKLEEAPTIVNRKDAHQMAFAKEQEMARLRDALGVRGDYQLGQAFDFELQEQKRLEAMAERDQKRKDMKLERLKERIQREDQQQPPLPEDKPSLRHRSRSTERERERERSPASRIPKRRDASPRAIDAHRQANRPDSMEKRS